MAHKSPNGDFLTLHECLTTYNQKNTSLGAVGES